jgi:mannose-6-phosphate isomerase-like protein (cupin superfamily)
MRFLLAFLLTVSAGLCQIRDVLKSGEIDQMFARTTEVLEVLTKPNYAVQFRVSPTGSDASQTHPEADEFWFVRRGAAKVSLNDRRYDVNAGDVVSVPRATASQITPASRFEYVAVRIFPTERHLRIGIGAAAEPHPMPDVATKAKIDATLASAEKNVTLHSAGTVLINHVVYLAKPGPWEVHQTCDDLYFVRLGSARAKIDGTLINAKEDPPGELKGTGVTGAREFHVEPGDMVVIPRNTAHFMDPGSVKLGYLLVKVCE